MARYFFNIHDGGVHHDEEGVELPDLEAVRQTAMQALPAVAADEIPEDGDRRHFVVVVTDSDGRAVYTATLSYVGLWLQ